MAAGLHGSGDLPHPPKMKRQRYQRELLALQVELVKAQYWIKESGERGEWYFQRYVRQLPTSGEIALFDRSWYNRAGVERVLGFCTPQEYVLFLRQAPDFERWLVDDGIWLFKLWLAVNRDEQRRRLEARKDDPLKTWKLSPIDHTSLDHWDATPDRPGQTGADRAGRDRGAATRADRRGAVRGSRRTTPPGDDHPPSGSPSHHQGPNRPDE